MKNGAIIGLCNGLSRHKKFRFFLYFQAPTPYIPRSSRGSSSAKGRFVAGQR